MEVKATHATHPCLLESLSVRSIPALTGRSLFVGRQVTRVQIKIVKQRPSLRKTHAAISFV